MKDVNKYTILAVDDAKDSLMLLEFDLIEAGYQVVTADSGNAALSLLQDVEVDLVLLDMYMPGISGLSTLQEIKNQSNLAHTPVIMLSASGDQEQIVAALEFGEDDYVTKPYISNVLLARMRNSLRLMEKTQQLEKLAKTDSLTQVNNRGSFEDLVSKAISQAKRTDQNVSLAMFDLDFFKNVNDTYGHETGDKALIDFAGILIETFRDYDIIGRIGGEEFAVCMPNTLIQDAFNACERCREALESHNINVDYEGSNHQLSLTVSIGVTSARGHLMDFDDLLRIADHGLYKAKKNGRNQSVIEGEFENINKNSTTEVVGEDVSNVSHSDDQATEIVSDEKYPGINYSVGLNNVLGDEDLFAEILVMFYQDHGQDHLNIEQAINEGAEQKIKHLVHTLKGVSCSVGALELFECCKVLDIAVTENNTEQYQDLFAPLKVEIVKVVSGIELRLADKL
ncbi:MAG: diguanylate cyclase [Colwelliaceae bacterium]|nr:diguanylate cyclase [Colwelliaceae bacterium]